MGEIQKEKLTDKQIKVMEFIRDYIDGQGFPPTVREIAQGVGLKSTSTVQGHLNKLEKKGYIERKETAPRTIKIIGGL